MQFPQPLARGVLVARYKRFFADVVMDDGREITAHCPNPGAMLGLNRPGAPIWLSRSDDPKRKLAHTLELVEADGKLVGVNTMHPNRLVAEALAEGRIPELAGYASARREVRYGTNSRVDFLLAGPDQPSPDLSGAEEPSSIPRAGPCWVEVKGVTLSRAPGLSEWPDCVSARGARHLGELGQVVARGERAVVVFVVQRTDCDRFAVAADLDPVFATAFERVVEAGVEILVQGCDVSPQAITLSHRIPWPR